MTKNYTTISYEDIATYPQPGNAYPGNISFSSDDRQVIYLDPVNHSLVKQLVSFDTQTFTREILVSPSWQAVTEDNLSAEEKLRRERQRQLNLGIPSYQRSQKTKQLLIPLTDGLYIYDYSEREGEKEPSKSSLRQVAEYLTGPLLDARFSPDGQMISYIQDGDIYISRSHNNTSSQLTFKPNKDITNGLAEYIAQEEMGRSQGYWWSPDSQMIAFEQVDESNIPVYHIIHQGKDTTGDQAQEDHHYPFAGGENARVRLGVVSLETRSVVWMDLGSDHDVYLARVYWLPDGQLIAAIMNRKQTKLELLSFDPFTGIPTLILREESNFWINLHDLFKPIKKGPYAGCFIWGSERSGFMHLYLYHKNGELLRTLTSGSWVVDTLDGVDEEKGIVYFTAGIESPLESHLHAVSIEGGDPCQLTKTAGMHSVILDHACRRFVDVYQSTTHPPRVTLRSIEDGSEIALIYENHDPRLEKLTLTPPQLVNLTNRHGDVLYGAIYSPPESFGSEPHPLIVSVYGGPHSQQVCNAWRMTANLRAQSLARKGYLVFVLDNRGSARRGLEFEGWISHRLGHVEVEDQVDGVNWLISQGLVDSKRVGIYGWSYGGYMALMCLARAPQVFHCAVAGAPVVHWDGYDTCYTERYMGLPQENSEGYRDSSVIAHVNNMTGKLMLVHGLIDENVHFRHTARLINALIKAHKPYELMLFPDERHTPRNLADREYMEEHISHFFEQNLSV